MPRPVVALAFFAACALGGGFWGVLVRAFWDLRWRIGRVEGPLQPLLRALAEWSDVLPIVIGMLFAAGLYRRLLRPGVRRVGRGWRWEAAIWAVLAAAALIWSHPHARGAAYWGGAAVHTCAARVALLALQLSFRVVCDLGRSGPRRLGQAWGQLLLYLIGRGTFVFVFMKALRLRGERAMYLIVPAGAALVEGILLVIGAGSCLLAARLGSRALQDPGGVESEAASSSLSGSGKNS